MRYVCSICGYVYDEAKEAVPFANLPDSWVCPLCGASKTLFVTEQKKETPKASAAPVQLEGDLSRLTPGVLAAICSNLARGSEKQYNEEEAALFKEIADYFTSVTPPSDAGIGQLAALFQQDLEEGYPVVGSAAKKKEDRGTQRVCVWGEKVTNILYSLLERYRREGSAFLKNTQIWVCSVCGFVYVGDRPPQLCPVCKVPDWKFDQL